MGVVDDRAVKTLFQTYWSSAGWRTEPATPPEDLAHAVDAGVMFNETVTMMHDELVRAVHDEVAKVSADQAAQAFLGSLSTRRLEQRSALGSYAVAKHLATHSFEADADGRCAVCGLWERERDIDRNILNFERFKWGGVRRTDLTYVWHDLERFAAEEPMSASEGDREALEALLDELDAAPSNITAPKAAQTLLRSVKGNKDERSVLLDILGVCSVLETPEQKGFDEGFVRSDSRPLPPLRFVERAYPVCWWTGEHGVNRRAAVSIGLL
jgi:hypothetical protein